MQIRLTAPLHLRHKTILPASKSISNRALIIHALAGGKDLPRNVSDCDDTFVMVRALTQTDDPIDIMAAGTAMRFLSAYWSVNEAVNDVPCGVCFSDPLGRIVLCNTKMQELSRIMTGSYLQDYEALRKAMNGRPESEGLRRLSKDSNVFYFPDGSVWMFQEYSLQEPDCVGYLQTVAVNVSEIYYNGEKIRANNEKLEILNHKLEEMYEKIGDKIREQETLVMKMQVHDNFGRSLLSIRRILERKENGKR